MAVIPDIKVNLVPNDAALEEHRTYASLDTRQHVVTEVRTSRLTWDYRCAVCGVLVWASVKRAD